MYTYALHNSFVGLDPKLLTLLDSVYGGLHVFHCLTIISTKNYAISQLLGLGIEYGPQRIRDLAFVCP